MFEQRHYCQGFYRETSKFLVAAYLKNDKPDKAAEEGKPLLLKIEDYVDFCQKVSSTETKDVVAIYGKKAADNMANYTIEWIDGKLKFMLGHLRSWSNGAIFSEFEKLI